MPQSTINETIPPPPRPFIVATDLSHYVVRETDTGKSLTKRCTFDEAAHATATQEAVTSSFIPASKPTSKPGGPAPRY